jgi:protein-S-isoprenylcysteine O-methyltransferase Ste14
MHRLELKILPPFVFLISAGGMVLLHLMLPKLVIVIPGALFLAALCFIASGYVGLKAIWDFKQAETSVHPKNPEKASKVVSSGIYQYSRNPMYLGLLLLLICEGVVLGNVSMLVVVYGFVFYMTRFQIVPEERALTARFGREYLDYQLNVRRWV